MATTKTHITTVDLENVDEGYLRTYRTFEEMLPTMPKEDQWLGSDGGLLQYQGCWQPKFCLLGCMLVNDHFKPRPTDIILSTSPKCGTTWLRALIFAIIKRDSCDFETHPLLTSNPRDLVPFLELFIHEGGSTSQIDNLPSPRFLSTHLPCPLLPKSMACRFVYIYRDPKDVLISMWHFMKRLRPKELPPLSLGEAFDMFCKGVSLYGPFWDHVLGYWKASLESPKMVLFLKYEDVKREPSLYVRELADFLDLPFSAEEENEGIVEKIVNLCSFENLSNLDVNKIDKKRSRKYPVNNSDFFRKAQVGDWMHHLTPEMAEALNQITKEKFQGTGLSFN